jgi:hypothetical protein
LNRELFIYWRVARGDLATAVQAVRHFQATLRDRHRGLSAGLYLRDDDAGGSATLMETYAVPGGGIDAAIQSEIVAAGAVPPFAACCLGERHVEAFERLPG